MQTHQITKNDKTFYLTQIGSRYPDQLLFMIQCNHCDVGRLVLLNKEEPDGTVSYINKVYYPTYNNCGTILLSEHKRFRAPDTLDAMKEAIETILAHWQERTFGYTLNNRVYQIEEISFKEWYKLTITYPGNPAGPSMFIGTVMFGKWDELESSNEFFIHISVGTPLLHQKFPSGHILLPPQLLEELIYSKTEFNKEEVINHSMTKIDGLVAKRLKACSEGDSEEITKLKARQAALTNEINDIDDQIIQKHLELRQLNQMLGNSSELINPKDLNRNPSLNEGNSNGNIIIRKMS